MATLAIHCSKVIKATEQYLADRDIEITRRREVLVAGIMSRPKHRFTRHRPTREEAIAKAQRPEGFSPSEWERVEWYRAVGADRAKRLLELAKTNPNGIMDITDKDVQYLAPIEPPTQRTE